MCMVNWLFYIIHLLKLKKKSGSVKLSLHDRLKTTIRTLKGKYTEIRAFKVGKSAELGGAISFLIAPVVFEKKAK